jgi:hypothetical protein
MRFFRIQPSVTVSFQLNCDFFFAGGEVINAWFGISEIPITAVIEQTPIPLHLLVLHLNIFSLKQLCSSARPA